MLFNNTTLEEFNTELINCLPRHFFKNYSTRILDLTNADHNALLAFNTQELFNMTDSAEDYINDATVYVTTDIPSLTLLSEAEISIETTCMRLGNYVVSDKNIVAVRCSTEPKEYIINMLQQLYERLAIGDMESSYKLLKMISKEKQNSLNEFNILNNDRHDFREYGELLPCQI